MESFGVVFIILIICMILGFNFVPIIGIIIAVLVGLLLIWGIASMFNKANPTSGNADSTSENAAPEIDNAGCSCLVLIIISVIVLFIIVNSANSASCTLFDVCVSIF